MAMVMDQMVSASTQFLFSKSMPIHPSYQERFEQEKEVVEIVLDEVEEGSMLNGYTPTYLHLSCLQMLSLYPRELQSAEERPEGWRYKHLSRMGRCHRRLLPTRSEKASLRMPLLGEDLSSSRLGRDLYGTTLPQDHLVIFTRWTVPSATGHHWFVDVLEDRYLDEDSRMASQVGNAIYLKAGLPRDHRVRLRIRGQSSKSLAGQKTWKVGCKGDQTQCDEVVFIDSYGPDVSMEVVAKHSRRCSSMDSSELLRSFDRKWNVPELPIIEWC